MNCKKCGAELSGASFCEYCGQSVEEQQSSVAVQEAPAATAAVEQTPQVPQGKPENVVTGTVGALLGAAIGGGSIILLSQLGYVASVSGLILAICTLKGYELLGNKLSVKGILISLVLMIAMPYVADRLDWAIVLMNAFAEEGVTLGQAFASVPMLIEEGVIEQEQYIMSLVKLYGFVALGAFSTVISFVKKKK